MPDFKPVGTPVRVRADGVGIAYAVYGWWTNDGWRTMYPVVANPEGSGVGPWFQYYGEDVWYVD